MEAFTEAKETGLIKHIGITGHNDLRILQEALKLSDNFDTVLLPVYVASLVNPDPVNDFKKILQIAREKNIGVTAIKAISKKRWKGDPTYNTWYEPLNSQESVNLAVWFTLSQEGVTTYSLPCDVRIWSLVLNAAKEYKKLNTEELENIVNMARNEAFQPLFPE